MVDLRVPPRAASRAPSQVSWTTWVQIALLLLIVLLLAWGRGGPDARSAAHLRSVAAKLRAGGALQESARALEAFVATVDGGQERAAAAFGLGETYLELGDPETALRWFYESEVFDSGDLRDELSRKVVHSLERLGRYQAAQSALDSRVRFEDNLATANGEDDDPVVARIEDREVRLSELERAIDDLPAALAAGIRSPGARRDFLRKYVADLLLWRKARKLEYDRDPKLKRQFERTVQQLSISEYLQREVLANVGVDESDLRNFFEANRERYAGAGEAGLNVSLDDVRPNAQRDYLQQKAQAAYQDAVDSELATSEVELYPERLKGGGGG